MQVTADTLDLKPPEPGRWATPVVLALVAHALLMAALTWGIHWKEDEPQATFEAEIWSALPREAAPRAVEPPPPPPPEPEPQPKPEPRPEPKPEPKPAPPPPQPAVKQPDIATEKARQKKLEEEKERKLEEAKKEKARKEKVEQAEREKKEKLKEKELAEKKINEQKLAEKKKQDQVRKDAEKREAAEADKRRKENLARMMGQVNGSGGQGKDSQSSGPNGAPSSGYAGRVKAKVSPNIRYTEEFARSLRTEIEVRALPDGTITGRKVVESSGNPAWDEAALKAIDRTGSLPRDVDGRVPSPIIIVVRPTD